MHELSVASHQNTFPLAVGARVTGVDDQAYSLTGDAYSHIVAPQSSTHTGRLLQKDDVSLAYEFARKFVRPTARMHALQHPFTPALLLHSRATRRTTSRRASGPFEHTQCSCAY